MMQFSGATPPDALKIMFVFFIPLQGFFNLIVYKSPTINKTICQFLASNSFCCSCIVWDRGHKSGDDGVVEKFLGKESEDRHGSNREEDEALASGLQWDEASEINTIDELTHILEA